MKTQAKILSGIGIIAVLMALTALSNSAMAGEINIGAGPGNFVPKVYLLKKAFDICDHWNNIPGGSVPPSGQQYGCVDFTGERLNEYAFTGEQIAELVDARDFNGAIDILSAYLQVDGVSIAKCNDITNQITDSCGGAAYCSNCHDKEVCNADPNCAWGYYWFGHLINFDDIPAESMAPQGFDSSFDKLYECILTVTPEMNGNPSEVLVQATDEAGATGNSPVQEWYFNPAIMIDVFTNDGQPITFDVGQPGQTVYSLNTLKIKNEAEGGVDLVAWLAGTDLTSPEVASKCPYSNVFDVEGLLDPSGRQYGIEYRCKIGTFFNNPWNFVQNPNDKLDCTLDCCQGAKPLIPDTGMVSIVANGHTAECWFRLTYPVPCVGDFTDGQILIYARAI
jgi:hypothetical protein